MTKDNYCCSYCSGKWEDEESLCFHVSNNHDVNLNSYEIERCKTKGFDSL